MLKQFLHHLDFSQAPDLSALEKEIIAYWDEAEVFAASLNQNLAPSTPSEFTFYDGPPFATGLPHYGHLLASTTKDLIPRYQTMCGKYVERRWGWDCHGLPIENIVEKELGLHDKKAIEAYGVAKFNEACRAKVMEYRDEWQKIIHRFGRFVDMDHDYKTMDRDYMESEWWVFKSLWERKLIYHDYKVMHYCPRCGTPLSNFEVTQGYQDVKDISVYVRFPLLAIGTEAASFSNFLNLAPITAENHLHLASELAPDFRISLVAWTTTPWTLPGNLALAVGPELKYSLVLVKNDSSSTWSEALIIASDLKEKVLNQAQITTFQVITDDLSGTDLSQLNLVYEPPFSYFNTTPGAFTVTTASYVTTEDGTGVVHIAPAFGEDDYQVGKQLNLPLVQHVNPEGCFTESVTDFAGLAVKPKENPQATDIEIIKFLAAQGKLLAKEKITHAYPHCWRCDTPLLNYATSSWFVSVSQIKDELINNNQFINWIPEHIKNGRFGRWLEGGRDWAISRNRYWGTPLPVWRAEEDGSYLCVGSVAELEKLLGGQKVADLHKHLIDDLVIYKDGLTYRRVPEVLDCWFESGSMPYAQKHYPFENKDRFEANFPAAFISEGQDQTRGWFYTLHVLATALTLPLHDLPPAINLPQNHSTGAYQNCVVTGIILAEDGKKMSKKLKNYPDPEIVFEKYGVDALRLYLMTSPVVRAETLNFNEKDLADLRRRFLIILWNVTAFYQQTQAEMQTDSAAPSNPPLDLTSLSSADLSLLDQWLLARTASLVSDTTHYLDQYDLVRYGRALLDFSSDLSNWYLRLSRESLREKTMTAQASLVVFGRVLETLARLMAPMTPFFAEIIYGVTSADPKSVHLSAWPNFSSHWSAYSHPLLVEEMSKLRQIVEVAHAQRKTAGVKVRQPLAQVKIQLDFTLEFQEHLATLLKQELNVKEVVWVKSDRHEIKAEFDLDLSPELLAEGQARELMRAIAQARKDQGLKAEDRFFYEVDSIPAGWQEIIESKTNTELSLV